MKPVTVHQPETPDDKSSKNKKAKKLHKSNEVDEISMKMAQPQNMKLEEVAFEISEGKRKKRKKAERVKFERIYEREIVKEGKRRRKYHVYMAKRIGTKYLITSFIQQILEYVCDHSEVFERAMMDKFTWLNFTTLSVRLPNNSTYSFGMLVRSCYPEIYDQIIQLEVESSTRPKITISGTPGVGKSMFALYFLIYKASLSVRYRTKFNSRLLYCLKEEMILLSIDKTSVPLKRFQKRS